MFLQVINGAQQLVVSEYATSLVQPKGLRLPEVALLLSELQMETAYSLLRTLRQFYSLRQSRRSRFQAALVQLPPVSNARSPYQVPPPESSWPIPQLPLNALKMLTATEVCLLATKLSKEDVRKYSRFDTLTTTLCDQQDALDEAQRRYDEQVESASARIT